MKHWTKDEESLMFDAALTYADIAEITERTVGAVAAHAFEMRKAGTLIPKRNASARKLMDVDADNVFGQQFHPNNGYWEPDGITYSSCTRCGINMALPDDQTLRSYCVDCNYPEFRAPFEAGSAVEYLSVVAA